MFFNTKKKKKKNCIENHWLMNQNEIYLGFENFKEQNFLENEEAILTMQIEIEEGNEKLLIKTNVPVDILRQHVIEVLVF